MKKIIFIIFAIIYSNLSFATNNITPSTHNDSQLLLTTIILFFAILATSITKLGQPAVLGQVIIGCLLGILVHYNIPFFIDIPHNQTISFLAELGSIFLLFEIGLESSLSEIRFSGKHAIKVALLGAIVPFILGYYIITPFLLNSNDPKLALFIGSMLAVTSTGISISVFKEFGIIKNPACQIVLTASVIDDIIGLLLLAITSGFIIEGNINLLQTLIIIGKIIAFCLIAYLLGKIFIPHFIQKVLIKVNNDYNTMLLTIVAICLFMAWFAHSIGLASVIGAFIAGLFLNNKYFIKFKARDNIEIANNEHHLPTLISPFGAIFIPIFFIYSGMQVDLIAAMNLSTIKLAVLISILAIIGKLCCVIFIPKSINKWIIGFGMIPRGEIGLIFATSGLALGIINNDIFAALLLMIIITSIITPIALSRIASKLK